MKTVLILTLLGALLGIAAASLIVPPALGWYNEAGYLASPPAGGQAGAAQPQALVNVPSLIRYTTTRLIRGQIIGAIAGAVLFLVIGILAVRRPRARPAADAAPIPRTPAAG